MSRTVGIGYAAALALTVVATPANAQDAAAEVVRLEARPAAVTAGASTALGVVALDAHGNVVEVQIRIAPPGQAASYRDGVLQGLTPGECQIAARGDYAQRYDPETGRGGTLLSTRGYIQVIDFTDPENPRMVARYEVTEFGTHNIWVEDDKLYQVYCEGGLRIVDVSGELMGNLYTQGREIAVRSGNHGR